MRLCGSAMYLYTLLIYTSGMYLDCGICHSFTFKWCLCPCAPRPQAEIFESDFKQERKDREKAVEKFEEEKYHLHMLVVAQNEQLEAQHLKYSETLVQLEETKVGVVKMNEALK